MNSTTTAHHPAAPTWIGASLARVSNGWSFVRAYVWLCRARRLIADGGLQAAERALPPARDRSRPGRRQPSGARIARLERAIVNACRWQVQETNCFPRAIAAYALLDGIGAEPTLRIGVRARPFAGHAWVEVDGAAIADTLTAAERASLRVLVAIPR